VRDGHAPNGKQKYRCHTCGRRSRENPTSNAYLEARREEILHASQERSSLRGLTHTFGVSRATVSSWITKSSATSSLTDHPARPGPRGSHFRDTGPGRTDGSFVLKKAHDSWMWIALCRKTRQVVAYAVRDRSKKTCQRLWEAIPQEYRQGHYFTDFLRVYASVIPEEQHTAVGKEMGETAHAERWNKTLRQRLARFVRMTLSFSKSEIMHEACLLLFLHRYHLDRAILLK
jgi:insertion element IS1 protein InsB